MIRLLEGHSQPIGDVAFDPKLPRLATVSNDNVFKLWNTETWELEYERTLSEDSPKVRNGRSMVQFSPNGKRMAIIHIDGRATVWDTRSKKLVWEPKTEGDDFFVSVVFLNDHRFVTSMNSASGNHNLKFWNLDSRDMENEFFFESKGKVNSLAYSAERKMLALGSLDSGTVSLFDTANAKMVWTRRQGNRVSSVAFNLRGHVVSAGNGAINFWDPADGNILFRLTNPHNDVVYEALLEPNDSMLITASGDDTVKLWRAATDDELKKIQTAIHGEQ